MILETIDITEARRLALARAGLLKPEWTGLPKRATGISLRARKAAQRIIRRFGYLQLFAFDQVLEIFKPAPKRKYGYYCLPVLAGDKFVGRVDLKAEWKAEKLKVLSVLLEEGKVINKVNSKDREAVRTALDRYAGALKLKLAGRRVS